MKKGLALCLALVLVLCMAACGAAPKGSEPNMQDMPTGASPDTLGMPDETFTMQATVMKITDGHFLVEPVEGSPELRSADRIDVSATHEESSLELEVGDIIEIVYTGGIAETYPAQISSVVSIKLIKEANSEEGLVPMVMVGDVLYISTGLESTLVARCGVMDGAISSSVDSTEYPTENDQSNFGVGYSYQYGIENTIEILIDGKWIIFEGEQAKQQVLPPA